MTHFKLQKIDQSLLKEHYFLEKNDYCFFFGDYAASQGYTHSPMNDLIHNFKKPVDRKKKQEWQYKEQAINKVVQMLLDSKNWQAFKKYTWIPIPPSKSRSDKDYDDRLMKVLLKLKEQEPSLDVRDLFSIKSSRKAAHEPDSKRPKPEEHMKNMIFDQNQKDPSPIKIIVFDDVITTGSHFKAVQAILRQNFPDTPIAGVFIARTTHTAN